MDLGAVHASASSKYLPKGNLISLRSHAFENSRTLKQELNKKRFQDYEFLFYKKDKDVTFIRDNKLYIKPKLRQDTEQLTKKESVWAELSDG